MGVARFEVAHADREVVAGRQHGRAIGQHQHRTDLARSARAFACGEDRLLDERFELQR